MYAAARAASMRPPYRAALLFLAALSAVADERPDPSDDGAPTPHPTTQPAHASEGAVPTPPPTMTVSTFPTAAPTTCVSGQCAYIGCYGDGPRRALDGRNYSDSLMTALMCYSFCQADGYLYYGTEYSTECFCGDNYDSFGESTECTMKCAGDADEICGGAYALSVYGPITISDNDDSDDNDDGGPQVGFYELRSDPIESESLLSTYRILKKRVKSRLGELAEQRVNSTYQSPYLPVYAACGRACISANDTWKRTFNRQRFNDGTAHTTNDLMRPPHIVFILADDLGYNDLG